MTLGVLSRAPEVLWGQRAGTSPVLAQRNTRWGGAGVGGVQGPGQCILTLPGGKSVPASSWIGKCGFVPPTGMQSLSLRVPQPNQLTERKVLTHTEPRRIEMKQNKDAEELLGEQRGHWSLRSELIRGPQMGRRWDCHDSCPCRACFRRHAVEKQVPARLCTAGTPVTALSLCHCEDGAG